MRIPLIEFEQYVDQAVLKRGRDYFKKGHVENFEEISSGEYEAVVSGTENYIVRLTVKAGFLVDHICNCPYELGPFCKHVLAAIFYLRQDDMNLKKPEAKSGRSSKAVKRKTVTDRVNETLEKVSHDELKQFVREIAEHDRSLREMFLSSFVQPGEGESKTFYVRQIKAILRSASDRSGFVDWRAAGRVGKEVSRLLDIAQKRVDERHYMSAVHICTAVLEQMNEAIQYADDSNGDVGDSIYFAMELLDKIAAEPPSEDVRIHLITYCFAAFDKKIYEGWDWHIGMLRLASNLIETDEEAKLLLARTEKTGRSGYEREEAECITYRTLLKTKGEKDAEKYLEQHIANSELRKNAIEKALKNKQYEKARSLAKDGVERDRKDKPGCALAWYDWLLKIAQAEEDSESIVKFARLLFIDNFRHEQDYYELLKKHVRKEKWADFVEELIRDIAAGKDWNTSPQIANIHIREAQWDRLLELVKLSPTLHALDTYEQHLKKDYARELASMYADAVPEYLKNNISRSHYQTACRYIRKIKKMGSPEKARQIIGALRKEYPQRRALLEELEMV